MHKHLVNFIIMHPEDNCATTLEDILPQTELKVKDRVIVTNHNIPLGHKIALENIRKGELVKKYGHTIGFATKDINKGDWIHIHNLTSQYLKEVLKI